MITKTTSFQTSDGQIHASIEQARKHELSELMESSAPHQPETVKGVIDWVLNNHDKVMDILTMKASSKSRARKINKKPKSGAIINDKNEVVFPA